MREELLKLNSASSEDAQLAKLRALVKDRAKAKKAVAEAAKMMKEANDKDKPFNYNGSWVTPIFDPGYNAWGFWFFGIWIPL